MYSWPQRKSLRLKNYDYSQDGIYFVTFCSYKNQCFFWEIVDGEMVLNDYWKLVEGEILSTEQIRDEIFIDSYIVMPNHVHMLIEIRWVGTAGLLSLQEKHDKWMAILKNTLSNSIQAIKSSATRSIRKQFNDYEFKWQRSFYDVIIKNEEQLNQTRLYIEQNPLKWHLDANNPDNEEKVKELRKQGKR